MLKDLTTPELLQKPVVKEFGLKDFRIPFSLKGDLAKALEEKGYSLNSYTSYAITDKAKDNKPANYAVIPNQYFIFACEMYEFAIELHKYFQLFDAVRSYSAVLVGSANEIESKILSTDKIVECFDDNSDILLLSQFLAKDDPSYRLGSKRLINDDGKPRGSKDCFGSVILKEVNLPDASSAIFGRLVYDLVETGSLFKELHQVYLGQLEQPKSKGNVPFSKMTLLPKPFILLAGISGTGKTRFVRKQAEASAENFGLPKDENLCLVPVRPDWHEPSDLLGYISRLNGTRYITTDFLKFMLKALCAAVESVEEDKLQWKQAETIPPYWLCLDEMNLAPVEQYFADYLSIIETREWEGEEYSSAPILKKAVFDDLKKENALESFFDEVLPALISSELKRSLCAYISAKGIPLPPNLIVAGTVNMDETTHGFSRKVIDRALTFDFGEFFPNKFDQIFEPKTKAKTLSFPTFSSVNKKDLSGVLADPDGNKTILFLDELNKKVLKSTPFELAYRALNEALLSVVCFNPETDLQLQAVWDDFLMCKVLPRIEGDSDKLAVLNSEGTENKTLLDQLESYMAGSLSEIWDSTRPDLLIEAMDNHKVEEIECRSKAKIQWMKSQLERNSFTSFWP